MLVKRLEYLRIARCIIESVTFFKFLFVKRRHYRAFCAKVLRKTCV
ncbi:hypothetical protein HMPREF1580_00208 [Gardnerella vaginalis JCP8070]|nr:hypothetical protein HMPREF1580_00208 [Gardnerella vaginalis JCP8070]